ncbi:cupredoxin family protein [Curvibacter sp. APW13]|uniref:cupredoxin domain-containing protein n=1 Tax=Curvibacter sp. APW13 TaxID=3077236 RepID=UPI0028E05DA7|nr:cupredoxin family protein [Curvibacter sp. APW13]MDT8992533.1 cupredoxin family protein [Curvibacter sp. APW13]
MKPILSKPTAVLLAGCLAAGAALASGTHSGGHEHYSYGAPGVAAKVTRTIEVEAADTMRFTPATIAVKKGETIRFVIRNVGAVAHEFSLGTQKELDEHYEVMKKYPNMEHDEPNKISLQPGAQGEIIWRFSKSGNVPFACLHVGHYDAGMKGVVKVK